MSGNSDSSTSESEVSACSSNFNPLKVLYSKKVRIPVKNAPLYENIQQFEAAQSNINVVPVGQSEVVQKREQEKLRKKLEEERLLDEKNKQRFAQYRGNIFRLCLQLFVMMTLLFRFLEIKYFS